MAKSSDEFFLYDVFLSFRGDGGTRYGFTDHLFSALCQKGIHTFRDDKELKIGAEIGPALLKAIRNSRMIIVVLCQNYASSTWCLNELAEIVDCYDNKGTHVLIVFYKVEPSHVWELKNAYADAMAEHEIRFGEDSKELRKWRTALSRVRDLTRVHCSEDMYESVLIEKIVKDTLAKLPAVPFQTKYLLGLDSQLEQVKALLDSNGDVCMLGIYGAGGIGKTTFALALYNKIRHRFQASSFLENVREKSNRSNGMEVLQRTLLSEMGEETQAGMGSTSRGSSEIKGRLGHKRVLLILDDVDAVKQLESLAGGYDWFGSGSRVIITTRDANILHNHDIEIIKYKMKELNYHESHELFCWHAFNMGKPAENYAYVSSRAVSYSKGIPLALKVIGSNMKGRSVEEWEIELQKYRNFPDAEIQGVLEISYNSLSELDQKIFLDIACFFKGERWDYVKKILDACDFFPVLRVFVSKCLITVDENGCLEMHDLIQDMGREIVRKESPSNPGDRSRLWSHREVLEVLQEDSGGAKIQGIMLDPPNREIIDHWTYGAFEKMKNLRILIVRNTIFLSGPSYLPNCLRLLDWKGYPSKSLPSNFHPRRIVDFKLPHSSLILKKPFQIFEDLTLINLSHCQSITQIPNLSGAKQLRVLRVDKCQQLAMFDISIGLLPKLVYLSASGCTVLKSFVPRMYLPALEVLSFNFCEKLEHFPDVMRKMDRPLKIHMISTDIKEFPNSIGNLIGLEYIDMSDCKGLKYLSSSFLLLPNLATLRLDECSQLGESFKRFKRHSVANGCPALMTLHLSKANLSYEDLIVILENFPNLEELNVSHNDFVTLPKCIKGSLHLKCLDVSFCCNLAEMPELPTSIQKVDARHCGSLTSEASSMLWSKVAAETQRIQIVMPMLKREIPEWFHSNFTHEVPLFWARKKFPIVALAFVFQEAKLRGAFPELEDSSILLFGYQKWITVNLYLFIDGQEVRGSGNRRFIVGEDHVLLCDLRVFCSDEELQGLDANFGDDWKVIEVQYYSDMVLLSKWGVYVYKQERNTDDIQFMLPNSLSYSVPKVPADLSARCMLENLNPRDMFNQFLPLVESSNDPSLTFLKALLRTLREVKAEIREKTSTSLYGASLKQEHEESAEHMVHVLEMVKENVPKDIVDSLSKMKLTRDFFERVMGTYVNLLNKDWSRICLPITLEYADTGGETCRRIWGFLEINVEDPCFKAVWRRHSQLYWEYSTSNEVSGPWEELNWKLTLLLKCHCPASEEASSSGNEEFLEEGYPNYELEELMRMIEQDAMSLNKSYGEMKASIVGTTKSFSPMYEWEARCTQGVQGMRRSTIGSLITFKKRPYGMMRVDDDPFLTLKKCFWYSTFALIGLIMRLFNFIAYVGLFLYRIPIIARKCFWFTVRVLKAIDVRWLLWVWCFDYRTPLRIKLLFVCGILFVKKTYLQWRIGQIMKKERERIVVTSSSSLPPPSSPATPISPPSPTSSSATSSSRYQRILREDDGAVASRRESARKASNRGSKEAVPFSLLDHLD